MITVSKVTGYCSGMPLLVFNVEQGCYYWELVIGTYFDIYKRKKIVTQRYYRGQPLYEPNGVDLVTPTYLQSFLEFLQAKDEWVYFANKGEVPPIVYYLN